MDWEVTENERKFLVEVAELASLSLSPVVSNAIKAEVARIEAKVVFQAKEESQSRKRTLPNTAPLRRGAPKFSDDPEAAFNALASLVYATAKHKGRKP